MLLLATTWLATWLATGPCLESYNQFAIYYRRPGLIRMIDRRTHTGTIEMQWFDVSSNAVTKVRFLSPSDDHIPQPETVWGVCLPSVGMPVVIQVYTYLLPSGGA